MWRNLVFGCWMLLAALSCKAQPGQPLSAREIDSVVNPRTIASGVLCFPQSEVCLGELSEEDAPVTVRFPFVNRGAEPLIITRVVTSCGCITADFDRAPIGVNASGEVTLTFRPKGHPGKLFRKVFVYTNLSAKSPTAQLSLTGTVRPGSNAWGDYPCTMGELRTRRQSVTFRGDSHVECIECVNAGDRAVQLRVEDAPVWLEFRTSVARIEPGAVADLVFRIDRSKLPPPTTRPLTLPVVLTGCGGILRERTIQLTISELL